MISFRRQTYSSQVVDFIKTSILKGDLAPGDQVKEMVLAERLGISRAPIREALQILAQDGLITSEPQKGKYIRVLSPKEIQDNYTIGGILEGAAAAMSAQAMSEADFNHLHNVLQRLEKQARKAESLAKLTQIDEEFHSALLAGADNAALTEMARSFCANISKFLLYNHWDQAFTPEEFFQRHRILFEAAQSRDPLRIEQTVREHYRESGLRMAQFGSTSRHEEAC